MDFASRTITAGGSPKTSEYTRTLLQTREKRIAELTRREKPPTEKELQYFEEQSNQQEPLRDNHSRNYKVNIAWS